MITIEITIKFLAMCFSLYLVGFFASMEAAFSTVDKLALTHLATRDEGTARHALGLAATRERLLGTILMGTNFAVVSFTVLGTSLMLEYSPFGLYSVPIASILIIVLVNLFGELIPKTRAARSPLRYTLSGTRYLAVIHKALTPLSYLMVELPKKLMSPEEPEGDNDTLRNIVELNDGPENLPSDEREMIFGVLDSALTPIREIMVPRVDVIAIDLDDSVQSSILQAVSSGYSRIPCYEESIDNISGILYIKDLFACLATSKDVDDLRTLMRPALFVPGSKRANDMLRELREKQIHMAIVVDEYGGTAGIITIEDLIEDIVGEIRDEYDNDEEDVDIITRSDCFVIHGRTNIDDLNVTLDTNFECEDAETVGGLILEKLGRLPAAGDCLEFPEEGYKLCVEKVAKRSIIRIRATRLT